MGQHVVAEQSSTEKLTKPQLQVAATAFLSLFSLVGISFYGLPFFYDFFEREFHWSRATITSGNAFGKIIIGPLFGFLAGWIIDRFGPRRLMLVGILMGGFALVGLSQMTALWMFYFFYLFNALGYVCGGPLPNQVLLTRWFGAFHDKATGFAYIIIGVCGAAVPWITKELIQQFSWYKALMLLGVLIIIIAFPTSRWFGKSRGKAMGYAYLGIGIGGSVVPQVARWLEGWLGWQTALATLGILMIAIAFPMAWFVKEQPAGYVKATEPPPPIRDILKSRAFYLLAIGSMCSIGAVGGTNQHLKLFLNDLYSNLSKADAQTKAANIITLTLASSIIGRLLMGWLADRFPKKYVMLLIYAMVSAAIPLLYFTSTPGVIYVFAIAFGIAFGGDYMIIPLMAAELFGLKVMGRVMGIILTADGLAEALSPMLVGRLYDLSKSYANGFAALIGLAVIGAIAIAMLPRKPLSLAEPK